MSSSLPSFHSHHNWNPYALPNDNSNDGSIHDANDNVPTDRKAPPEGLLHNDSDDSKDDYVPRDLILLDDVPGPHEDAADNANDTDFEVKNCAQQSPNRYPAGHCTHSFFGHHRHFLLVCYFATSLRMMLILFYCCHQSNLANAIMILRRMSLETSLSLMTKVALYSLPYYLRESIIHDPSKCVALSILHSALLLSLSLFPRQDLEKLPSH
jgi:hypothetical protein